MRDAARLADAFAHALGQHEVVAVAGREVGAGLGDADDRLARLQLLPADAVVQVALEIERGHVRIVGIVEPGPRPELELGPGGVLRFLAFSWLGSWRFPNVIVSLQKLRERVPADHEGVGDMAQRPTVDVAPARRDQLGELAVDARHILRRRRPPPVLP